MAQLMLRPGDKRDILAAKFEIEHEDVLHLKNLYKRIYEWLIDEGFVSVYGDVNIETLYWQRDKPGDKFEHHVWWRAVDVPRDNRYYRYFFKVNYQTLNCSKIEIMHKGQKFGTNKCDVIIRFEAWLQLDYNDEWKKHGLTSYFEKWFRERFYLEQVQKYKKDCYYEAYRLHTAIKQYLQFKMHIDWGRPFHPEKGV